MEQRKVGRSGLRISPISLGTANFGHVTEQADAHRIMSRATEYGVTLFDTANIYNYTDDERCTEAIIGDWLGADASRRDKIVLNTKVFGTIGDGPNDSGLSSRHIRLQCEASLKRLKTDWLDVYTLHHVDRATPFAETLDTLEQLKREGKILYYATSNFAAWQLVGLHMTADRVGSIGQLFEQSHYNLSVRDVEREVLPACRHFGIGFLAYSPLAEGLLAGEDAGSRRASSEVAARRASCSDRLEMWHARCTDHGLSPPAAAIGWLIAQPGVSSVIVGPRTLDQLDSAVKAADRPLSAETLDAVAEPWPGPGEAPEAYAW